MSDYKSYLDFHYEVIEPKYSDIVLANMPSEATKEAWNYQQKRIDELEGLLREACVYIDKTWLIPSVEFDEKIQQILKGENDE